MHRCGDAAVVWDGASLEGFCPPCARLVQPSFPMTFDTKTGLYNRLRRARALELGLDAFWDDASSTWKPWKG